jgi:hypothetical protein
MASRIGRLSAVWSFAFALGTALTFFALARWAGEAPLTGAVGGTAWVFILSLIVAMPLMAAWARRLEARPTPRVDQTPMTLSVGVWLCTVSFLFLVLGPWLGFTIALLVAGVWMVAVAVLCWMVCVSHRESTQSHGGQS